MSVSVSRTEPLTIPAPESLPIRRIDETRDARFTVGGRFGQEPDREP